MIEDDARRWIAARHDAAKIGLLDRFAEMVREENQEQNLISPSTITMIWHRHILDSAQLLPMADDRQGAWLDIGTGAGFPGLVVAILSKRPVMLVEPRGRRATFLRQVVEDLSLTERVTVVASKAETLKVARPPAIVSARAVASIDALLRMTGHLRDMRTRILLPRGRSGLQEVEAVRARWHGMFHVEQSLTDIDSVIVIADGVPS